MTLQQGQQYCGFLLQETRYVPEIQSTAHLFEHIQTGARLLYLANEDDNKVFSITFRTPPADSTGVAHIVEHSVLCGSRKFPIKEPFVELVKGSLNTFLNAMTFPDKTMYPVASRNDKDFRNLMDVYLDAVFYPNMYQQPEILMQEGWHYELEETTAPLQYKGVVYNEMKGVFSSPDAVLDQQVYEVLFPDSPYGFESGGDPDVVPELTQEAFLAFHKRYYHPTNSYIYLYGQMDIEEQLAFLHEAYLKDFSRQPVDSAIPVQPPFTQRVERETFYPVAPNEETTDKTMLSLDCVTGEATDPELYLALQILEYMLLETPAAPLKQALVKADIGKDVLGSFVKSLRQPTFGIVVTGSNPSEKERFCQVVETELRRLVKDGIDKKLVEAAINIFEFTLREANFGNRPKGLIYNIKCMDSWLYDASPLLHFSYEDTLKTIKTALTEPYFEKLIQRHLLDNPHQALLICQPSPGLAEKRNAEVREMLDAYKKSLSEAELNRLVEQTKALKERQQAVDSPEALATIPLLALKDLERKAEEMPLEERRVEDTPVLLHALSTNKIAYVNLLFNTGAVPQAQLPYLYLLAEVLGKVATEKYDYATLSNEINIHTGGVGFDMVAYSENSDDTRFKPRFVVQSKALCDKMPQQFHLLEQIVAHSLFADRRRMQELVQELKSDWDMNVFRRGQQLATNRVLSYFSPLARFNEEGMLNFYHFLRDIEKNWETQAEEVAQQLAAVSRLVFTRSNLMVSITTEADAYDRFTAAIRPFIAALPATAAERVEYQFGEPVKNEGLMTAGKVQYVVKGANFKRLGFAYHGSMRVLETILRYEYLWNRIRVQGGAYGAFAKFDRNGNMVFGSYRDPNLRESVAVYDEMPDYLRSFCVSEREMTKYIIGTLSQLDMPLSPQQKGERAVAQYLRNVSQADIQAERDQVLQATAEDICRLAELVEAAMQQNYLCVLGSEEKIREQTGLFEQLVAVSQ